MDDLAASYPEHLNEAGDRLPSGRGECEHLRAITTSLGVTIARYLLELEPLRDASGEQITSLLRPYFQALTGVRFDHR